MQNTGRREPFWYQESQASPLLSPLCRTLRKPPAPRGRLQRPLCICSQGIMILTDVLLSGASPIFNFLLILLMTVGRQLQLGDTLSSTLFINISSALLFRGRWVQPFGQEGGGHGQEGKPAQVLGPMVPTSTHTIYL